MSTHRINSSDVMVASLIRNLILVSLSIIVYGCGTSNIRSDFDPTTATSNGIIFGTATQNIDSPGNSIAKFIIDSGTGVTLKSLDSKIDDFPAMSIQSDFTNQEDGTGRLFVIQLTPGNHKIDTYQIEQVGSFILYPKAVPPELNFNIKAGEIIYVGNFHMNIVSGENFIGMKISSGGIPTIQDKRDRDLRLLLEKYPQFKGKNITYNVLHDGPWVNEAAESEELVIPKSK